MNISLGLDAMIESLGLAEENIQLWSINDNASNMHVAIRESKYLRELNCGIHTISLAVCDTFKDVQGMKKVLKRSKKLAKFAHSEGPMRQLKNAVESSGLKFKKPKNPGETRWSSQVDCMESLQPYKGIFDNLSVDHPEWERRNLSKQQWKMLDGACVNLKSFRDTIKAWEGEKEPTLDRVIERLYVNHSVLDSFISDPKNQKEKCGVVFARKLKENLEVRFPAKGTECEIYCKANYLNPKYRGIHLMAEDKLEEAKSAMEEEWKQKQADEVLSAEAVSLDENVLPAKLSPTSQLRKKLGTRMEYRRHQKTSQIRKEMDRYESFSTVPKHASILSWWKRMTNALPILSEIARSVLAIPASSAKSERVFSKGGNIVTVKRTRLNPKKVEKILIIQENKKRVKEFMKKTTYEVKPNEGKGFSEIDIKELVRVHEEVEEEEEDSDDGADAFDDSDVEEGDTEEYDTDDFSDEFTDEED